MWSVQCAHWRCSRSARDSRRLPGSFTLGIWRSSSFAFSSGLSNIGGKPSSVGWNAAVTSSTICSAWASSRSFSRIRWATRPRHPVLAKYRSPTRLQITQPWAALSFFTTIHSSGQSWWLCSGPTMSSGTVHRNQISLGSGWRRSSCTVSRSSIGVSVVACGRPHLQDEKHMDTTYGTTDTESIPIPAPHGPEYGDFGVVQVIFDLP